MTTIVEFDFSDSRAPEAVSATFQDFVATITLQNAVPVWNGNEQAPLVQAVAAGCLLRTVNFPSRLLPSLRAAVRLVEARVEPSPSTENHENLARLVAHAMHTLGICTKCGRVLTASIDVCPHCGHSALRRNVRAFDPLMVCRACTGNRGDDVLYHGSYRFCPRCSRSLIATQSRWSDFGGPNHRGPSEEDFMGEGQDAIHFEWSPAVTDDPE